MKKLLSIIVVLISSILQFSPANAQCGQTNLYTPNPPDGDHEVQNVVFKSATEAWAVGKSEIIIKATYSGTNWTVQDLTSSLGSQFTGTADLNALFINGNTMYVSDDNTSSLYRSVDGGTTWTNLYTFSSEIQKVAFSTTTTSWGIVGTEEGLFVTSNGGTTWQKQKKGLTFLTDYNSNAMSDDTAEVFPSIYIHEATKTVFVGAEPGQIYAALTSDFTSTDLTFTKTFTLQQEEDYSDGIGILTFDGVSTLWASGEHSSSGNAIIKATVSATPTWTGVAVIDLIDKAEGIQFVSATNGFIADDGANIFSTTNGGTTWTKFQTGKDVNGLVMVPGSINKGLFSANADGLFLLDCSGATSISQSNVLASNKSISFSPNPTDGLIKAELPVNTLVQIYNQSGIIVKQVIMDGASMNIDLSSVEKGLYFVKATNDGLSISEKIIIQ